MCKGGGWVKEDSSAERKAQRTMMDEPTMQMQRTVIDEGEREQ